MNIRALLCAVLRQKTKIAGLIVVIALSSGIVWALRYMSAPATPQPLLEQATLIGPASLSTGIASPSGEAINFAASTPDPQAFVHPGIFVSQAQLEYLKDRWASNTEPWASAISTVRASTLSNPAYVPRPGAIADCSAYPTTCSRVLTDAAAAYTLALLYYSSNEPDRAKYAQGAIRIMNAWATTLTSANGYQAQLTLAWAGEVMPRAAEIIRYTYTPAAGETPFNVSAFTNMLQTIFLPQYDPTLLAATSSNGNWDLAMADAKINIGIFTNNRQVFEAGLNQWRARVPAYIYMTSDGPTPVAPPGGLYNDPVKLRCFWLGKGTPTTSCTVPPNFSYVQGMAQETCRDISHVVQGMSSIVYAAETARIQNVDLYGEQHDRIVTGLEYSARFNNQYFNTGVWPTQPCGGKPFNGDGVSGNGYTYGWEVAYNHFANREGLSLPETLAMVQRVRPTKAVNHTVWETLTHAAPDVAATCTPQHTQLGAAVITANAPIDGTYKLWTLVKNTSANGTYAVRLNYGCPMNAGSSTLTPNEWTWIDYAADSPDQKLSFPLAKGNHTLFYTTQSTGFQIAKVMLVGDPSCTPAGDGENCNYIYDITPPSTPTGLRSAAIEPHAVTLAWDPSSDDTSVTAYQVLRDEQVVGIVSTTSFTDTSLAAVTTYAYRVQAVDGYNNASAPSEPLPITTTAAPATVHLITPSADSVVQGDVLITASVSSEDSPVTRFDILVDGTPLTTPGEPPLFMTTWDSTQVANGPHVIQARAETAYGAVSFSPSVNILVANADITPPSTPQQLAPSEQTETSITLSWQPATDDTAVAHYVLYRDGVAVGTTDQTALRDELLTAYTTYAYQVAAVDVAGNTSALSASIDVRTTDTTPPGAPQNVRATLESPTTIVLNWDASTDNVGVTAYQIQRNGGVYASTSTTTFVDAAAENGMTYTYAICAQDASGNTSACTQALPVTVPDTTAPSAPTDLTASTPTETSIVLNWDASTDNVGVAEYVVYRDQQQIGTTANTSYTDATLLVATSYSYTIRAIDAAGNVSGTSNGVNITTPDLTAPAIVAGLSGSVTGPDTAQLTWNASTDNVGTTGYRILRDNVLIATTQTIEYFESALYTGQTYVYKVQAIDAAGNASAPSEPITITIPDTAAPTAPGDVTATQVSSSTVQLAWSPATDNVGVTAYQVLRNNVLIQTTSQTSYTDNGLSSGTQYTYVITAIDAAGNVSGTSLPVSITTADTIAPTAVSGLGGYAQTPTQLVVTWQAATDNEAVAGYRVSRNGSFVTQISSTTFTDSTLAASTDYTYSIVAVDGAGNTGPVTTVQLATLPTVQIAGAGFAASYFNNTSLSGAAALTRRDSTVNFTWGTGSPGAGVNTDNFSVRWTGRITPSASGTYTFYTDTDDGVRLWINGQQLINKWSSGSNSSATFAMNANTAYDIKMEYYDATRSATAKLSWKGPGISSKTIIPSSVVSSAASGLSATYFSNTAFTGSPTLIRPDRNLNFSWGSGSPDASLPANGFSARWTGKLIAPTTGTHTLSLESSGGARLWLNGQLLIDNWAPHATYTNTATVSLDSGTSYDIRVEYQDVSSSSAAIKLFWSYGATPKTIIPQTAFRDR